MTLEDLANIWDDISASFHQLLCLVLGHKPQQYGGIAGNEPWWECVRCHEDLDPAP